MKQKITIKVQMYCEETRVEAMKTASKQAGVTSIEVHGADKDLLVIVGEGVDAVELTRRLRKRVGCSELRSVEEVKEKPKEPEKKEPEKKEPEKKKVEHPPPCDCCTYPKPCHVPTPCYVPIPTCDAYDPSPGCSIL